MEGVQEGYIKVKKKILNITVLIIT
jgi:hypothetical protein